MRKTVHVVTHFIRQTLHPVCILCLLSALGGCAGAPATSNPTTSTTPNVAPAKPKPPESEGYTISGDIQYWRFGDLVLRAETNHGDDNAIVVASSEIAADGTFTITLPETNNRFKKSLKSYSSQMCEELYEADETPVTQSSGPGYTVMPEPLVQAEVNLYAYQDVNDPDSAIWIQQRYRGTGKDGYAFMVYRFSQTAGSYTGNCAGTYAGGGGYRNGETFDDQVNQQYVAGWNTEVHRYTYTKAGVSSQQYVGPAPADMTWIADGG